MTTNLPPRDTLIGPGELAPLFELPTQNRGETFKLAEAVASGGVVLSFFPMAFTGVCGTEMECITRELSRLQQSGKRLVGISCDSGPALKAWADQLGLKHTLLSDMHRSVCKGYGLFWPEMNLAARGTVVIDRSGKVSWSQKREVPKAFSLDEVLAHV